MGEIGEASISSSGGGVGARPLRIAVQGCCHGTLDRIYSTIEAYDAANPDKPPVDLLLCCGDFQALRNASDLDTIAVPPKYREMGSFYKYYSGQVKAPVLTVFVGGNHEASAYLQELFYGGWVAPNIYYIGAAGVVNFCGIRIAGLSGIFKSRDYEKGRYEFPPYDNSSLRSVYHVRNVEVYRLKCIQGGSRGVDIVITHDWPRGVEQHGDTGSLIRKKKFFQKEIEENCLGSPANEEILYAVKPRWWFAAHLHVKFSANVPHRDPKQADSQSARLVPSQIKHKPEGREQATTNVTSERETTSFVGLESSAVCPGVAATDLTAQMTKFLSLDKCLPRRHHLQIVNVSREDGYGHSVKPKLEYDLEWLAILRRTHYLTTNTMSRQHVPNSYISVSDEDMAAIRCELRERQQQKGTKSQLPDDQNPLEIPENFVITASPYGSPGVGIHVSGGQMIGNPQTDELLSLLCLDHVITTPYQRGNASRSSVTSGSLYSLPSTKGAGNETSTQEDENEIDLCEDDEEDMDGIIRDLKDCTRKELVSDNNEIHIDFDSEDVDVGANAAKKPRTNCC